MATQKMTDQFVDTNKMVSIIPPPELIEKWHSNSPMDRSVTVATQAARWGADQQLTADAKWLDHNALNEPHLRITPVGEALKAAMRPKPPSLKEQALETLRQIPIDPEAGVSSVGLDTIRRALEQLDD